MKRLEFSDFLAKANKVHMGKYSYEMANYLGNRIEIKIICPIHGVFKQTPKNHLYNKQGCPSCYGNKKLTTEEFISKATIIHDGKYDYSKTIYGGNKGRIEVLCPIHGLFTQIATRHLSGDGCPSCGGSSRLNNDLFIKKAKEIHGESYLYDKLIYRNNKTKVIISCPKHGDFNIIPQNHIGSQKQGCYQCAIEYKFKTTQDFIEKANLKHFGRYDYSKVDYKHNNSPIIIICSKHGEFKQKPNSHLTGRGCRKCSMSKGEIIIEQILKSKGINFESQKKFDKCKNKTQLPFDFYIPEKKILIEFDGEQHKKINNFFGGQSGFKYRKKNDEIKNNYAKDNNLKLIRISYNELRNNNIENILNDLI